MIDKQARGRVKPRSTCYLRGMDTVLSILVLAAMALVWGTYALWKRGGSRKQIALMLLMAAILAANVAIWVLPIFGTPAPVSTELK